jgi:hypothetical protein
MLKALMYYRSVPSGAGFGALGDAMTGILEAGIVGSIIGGIATFVAALVGFRATRTATPLKIVCTGAALTMMLFMVGVVAYFVFMAVVLHI